MNNTRLRGKLYKGKGKTPPLEPPWALGRGFTHARGPGMSRVGSHDPDMSGICSHEHPNPVSGPAVDRPGFRLIRDPGGVALVGNSHHASSLGFPVHSLPSIYYWEDYQAWELPSPFPGTRRGSRRFYFIHMFYLAYITIVLLTGSEYAVAKICEIKIEKNTNPCCLSAAVDPAKCGPKRVCIELAMLDFRTEHCQLIVRA